MDGEAASRAEVLVRPWPVWRWSERLAESGRRIDWRFSLIPILALGCIPLYLGVNTVGPNLGSSSFDPSSGLDAAIPALPWTSLIYLSLFWLFYPLSFFAGPADRRGRMQVYSLMQGLILLQLVSNLIFLLFPTGVHLRQQMLDVLPTADALSRSLMGGIHGIDSSHSAWPSLHISHGVLISLALHRWLPARFGERAVPLRWLLWFACAALAVSTLTTKQHYLFDVATGGALAALVWNRLLAPWWDRLDAMADGQLPRATAGRPVSVTPD